jgi:hypothetical protein
MLDGRQPPIPVPVQSRRRSGIGSPIDRRVAAVRSQLHSTVTSPHETPPQIAAAAKPGARYVR